MKKICIGFSLLFMLLGCSAPLQIEEEAILEIAVSNEEYGEGIKKLWNEAYPEHQDSINIHVLEENEIENYLIAGSPIPYDLFYIEDSWVGLAMDQLYEMPKNFENHFEVKINPEFSEILDKVKPVYYALEANGFLYMVDENKIAKEKLSLEDFKTFERLSEIENSFYYLEQPVLTLALMSSDVRYFPGKNHNVLELDGAPFKTSLTHYLMIMEMLQCENDPASFDNWFLNHKYYSGLVGPWMQVEKNEQLNDANYHYLPLPTIQEQPLHTLATSYGYVIQKDTLYPQAALSCLQLIHSVKGMQLLCDTTAQVPLILEDQLSSFSFDLAHQEEKIIAMNYAIQDSLVGLEGHEEMGAIDFLEQAHTIQLINACQSDEIQACVEQVHQAYEQWLNELD